ncbi:MAG TPA: ATP-binding protein [Fulvivirga sp.]|nr:ATP-binding protein [Fulvivirga sp.]
MKKQNIKILFIEDDKDDYDMVLLSLKKANFNVTSDRVQTELELTQKLKEKHWNLVISDNKLPTLTGPKALIIVREIDPEIPFILVSGTIGEEAAVEIMRSGANDYILKDNLSRLAPAIEREIRDAKLRLNQKQNKRNLILSELKYQLLTESIKNVFFALDNGLKITFWNEAAHREFDKKNVVGQYFNDVFPEWKYKNITRLISKSMEDGKVNNVSITYEANETEYYEGTIFPTGEGVSVLLSKVTELKRNRDNLVRLNNELETLLYRIAHDLRGPVASVIGLINISKNDSYFQKEQFLEMMNSSMSKLNHILKELINISNIKLGKPHIQLFRVKPIMNEIIENIQFSDHHARVNCTIDIDENLDILSDIGLFRCIWQNLIVNAVKYSKEGKINEIKISASKTQGKLFATISDTGQGISAKQYPRLYEMFYRGNVASSGPGLGLYVVKNALMKIKGEIELNRNYKKGARFDVWLPDFKNKITGTVQNVGIV